MKTKFETGDIVRANNSLKLGMIIGVRRWGDRALYDVMFSDGDKACLFSYSLALHQTREDILQFAKNQFNGPVLQYRKGLKRFC